VTVRTIRQRMGDDMVRRRHLRQCTALVTGLSSVRSFARLNQTLPSALLQTVAARRLAAVATVIRQLILRLLEQRLLRRDQLDQALLPAEPVPMHIGLT
jgi:hypothetical protein